MRKHKFQRTFVKDLADQIQMDLVDMGKYKNQNKGYYWILTAVEILSRYAFTIPVYRKDTKNMTKAGYLSAINKTDDVYRVEKILRRRKGQALVKWAGYDSKHNSWIPIKDIQSLK